MAHSDGYRSFAVPDRTVTGVEDVTAHPRNTFAGSARHTPVWTVVLR
ncbi:MAG: hypothetical protein ABW137_28605 [Mycobacterium sp.]